jgi:DNA polymerase-3 subunit delta
MKPPSSIYLIFGEDTYLVEQGLHRVLSRIRHQVTEDLAVETIDCKEMGLAGVFEEMASPSLFSNNKAMVLKNLRLAGESKLVSELGQFLASGLPPGQFLILVPDKVDKRLKTVKAIAKQGEVLEFGRLSDEGLREWILERFKGEGKTASQSVAETLIDLKGNDLRTLDSEIEKAVTYVGTSKRVTQKDVEALVGRSRVEQAFELVTHILLRRAGEALDTLRDLLEANQSPVGMVYRISAALRGLVIMNLFRQEEDVTWREDMSFGEFRSVVLPRYREWAEAKGIDPGDALLRANPYFTYSRFKEGGHFELGDLLDLLEKLLEANVQLVSTAVSPKVILERVVATISE